MMDAPIVCSSGAVRFDTVAFEGANAFIAYHLSQGTSVRKTETLMEKHFGVQIAKSTIDKLKKKHLGARRKIKKIPGVQTNVRKSKKGRPKIIKWGINDGSEERESDMSSAATG